MKAVVKARSCVVVAAQAWGAAWREWQAESGIGRARHRLGGGRKTVTACSGKNEHYAHVIWGMRLGTHSPRTPHSAWS